MANNPVPSVEELLEALEKMDVSDDEKRQLAETLLQKAKLEELGLGAEPQAGSSQDLLILLLLISLVFLVLVFFGYKLYKALTEREKKKEEKRRQKQQKKKK